MNSSIDYSKNSIIVSRDVESLLNELKYRISHRVIAIYRDDFLLEDAKEVVANAYIASENQKTIVFGAKSFNLFAQNSLLKIIEEPPKNVNFIIISTSKSALLPTIRSRMPIFQLRAELERESFPIDLRYLDLKSIFLFIKDHSFIEKDRAKRLVESLLFAAMDSKIKLRARDLELFSKSILMIGLNERPQNVFSMLLLALLERKKGR